MRLGLSTPMYKQNVPIKRKQGKIVKKCKECGKEFESWRCKIRAYCSYDCSNQAIGRRRTEKLTKEIVCKICGKIFKKRPSDLKKYKRNQSKRGQYCSRECWRAKVQTISSLKKKVWIVFSLYIRNRDNWQCFTCGKIEKGRGMHAGHFISRSHANTLFDEMNVHAQCASCNMFRNGEPDLYAAKLIKIHGEKEFLDLIKRGRIAKSFTKPELLEIHDHYKKLST